MSGFGQTDPVRKQAGVQESSGPLMASASKPIRTGCESDPACLLGSVSKLECIIIIIMYIYYALINALSAHMIHINLNMIFYIHVEYSPTKTIYIKY